MFENSDYDRLELIYLGLKALIESGNGYGLLTWGDSPEQNLLFKMLSELTEELKKRQVDRIWFYDFSDWQKFCQFVIDAHRKRVGYRLSEDEATRIGSACETEREKIVIWTLLDTGVRPSQLVSLKEENIDGETGRLRVRGLYDPRGVHIPPKLQPIIEDYFSSHATLGVSMSAIHRLVKRVANRANIAWPVKPSDLWYYWLSNFPKDEAQRF